MILGDCMGYSSFEKLFLGAVAKFIFDQSTAHAAQADDAFNVNEMNVRPGRTQQCMHPMKIPDDNSNSAF